MGKLNSCLSWASLQLYIGMSQARHLLIFMKFYANLSGWEGFFLITLWKSYNLFVQLGSRLHRKSCTSSIFLVFVWICQAIVWQTTFGWVLCSKFACYFLSKGVIRQGDSSWREERCVCPGETGALSGELCQAGDRDRVRTAGWALTEGLWLNSSGNRFPGLGNLLNNLPGSAGMIKTLPLFRKVHNRLKLTW